VDRFTESNRTAAAPERCSTQLRHQGIVLTLEMGDQLHLALDRFWTIVLPNRWQRLKKIVQSASEGIQLFVRNRFQCATLQK